MCRAVLCACGMLYHPGLSPCDLLPVLMDDLSRHNRACSYNSTGRSAGTPIAEATEPMSPARSASSNDRATSGRTPAPPDNAFPVVYFLDSVLFSRSMNQLPDSNFNLDAALYSYARDDSPGKSFINAYFAWIHPPIPFLSKKIFMERVFNPLGSARSGNTLLVASMKLVASQPGAHDPQTSMYRNIKAALRQAENAGILDFQYFRLSSWSLYTRWGMPYILPLISHLGTVFAMDMRLGSTRL